MELNLLLGRGMLQASKDWLMDGPLFHQKKKVKTFGDYLKIKKILIHCINVQQTL